MSNSNHQAITAQPQVPTRVLPAQPRIALLLNANARRVTSKMKTTFAQYLENEEDLYFSTSMEEAHRFCKEIYEKEYDLVFTGGGDGTLLGVLSELKKNQQKDPFPKQLPAVGILPLGTGNAVASLLGISRNKMGQQLELAKTPSASNITLRPNYWVEVNGKLAPFAGSGADSFILNNYVGWKKKMAETPFSFLSSGGLAYTLAIGFSIPQLMFSKRTKLEVINEGSVAYQIGADGEKTKTFEKGETIFTGSALICGVSTIPCYGFRFNLFPFARSGQHMHLRIATLSVSEVLLNLPSIWRGSYRSPGLLDYHTEKVRIRYERPEPLQIGGDAAGRVEEVVYELSQEPTFLADFNPVPKQPAFQPSTASRLPLR